jgi:protocatechuate 3,4-dioxygenase beta subunit
VNEEVLRSRALISRRRALGLGGTIGLGGLLAACGSGGDPASKSRAGSTASATAGGAPSTSAASTAASEVMALLNKAGTCSLAKEETQGPYWFDVESIRTDIREKRPGTTLTLAVRVQDMSTCSTGGEAAPVASSVVEIWHCDAGGVYSGFESGSTGGVGGAPNAPGGTGGAGGSSGQTSDGSYSKGDNEATPTDDGTYLRGAQVTGADGIAQFTTIYPGWYRGRTVHIHLKVHIDKKTVLTTQLYLDESLNDDVLATSPYDEHTGRDTTNDNDGIFDRSGLLAVQRQGHGYLGAINLGVNV